MIEWHYSLEYVIIENREKPRGRSRSGGQFGDHTYCSIILGRASVGLLVYGASNTCGRLLREIFNVINMVLGDI